jgi:hypothetical protein
VTVVIDDDHLIAFESSRAMMEANPADSEVGQARDGLEAAELLASKQGRDTAACGGCRALGLLQVRGDLVPGEHKVRGLRDMRIGHDHAQSVESFLVVLHERVPSTDHLRAGECRETTHRPVTPLEMPMVPLDSLLLPPAGGTS